MSNLFTAAPTGVMRADALAGVRTRRIVAVCIDFVIVSLLVMALWIVSIVLTLGLALFFLPPLFPFVAFFYNGLTVSGPKWRRPACGRWISKCAWTTPARACRSSMRRSKRCCFT